jgi:hypothetical protein
MGEGRVAGLVLFIESLCLLRKMLVGERAARLWLIAAAWFFLSQTAR